MKKENHDIDQLFNRLDEYASPVPDSLWENLEAARNKNEKRKGFLWWKWGGSAFLLALLIPVGMYLLNDSSVNKVVEADNLSKVESNTLEKSSLEKINQSTTTPDATQIVIEHNLDVNKNKTDITSKTIAETKASFSKKNLNNTSETPDLQNQMLTNVSALKESNGAGLRTTPTKETNSAPFLDAKSTAIQTDEAAKEITDKKEGTVPDTDQPVLAPDESKEGVTVPKKLPIAAAPDLHSALPELNTAIKILKGKGPRGCYSFAGGRIKYDYYLDAFLSPEYVLRTLEAKDEEHESYRKSREDSERTLYGVSTGVRLSVVTRRGLALRTGMVYNQTVERMEIDIDNSVREVIVVDNDFRDTSRTVQTGRRIKTTYNRYRALDIPLLLGYEVDARNFVFNLNAGVYFNILAKQKGEILSESDIPMFINSNNPQRIQAFSKDLGISVYGSFGFNYQMKNGLQLLIEPNLRYQLKPITLDDYPLDQQYIHMGLLVGLRKQF